MDIPHWQVLLHIAAALVAGAAVGLERSFHGRPAGFRTHALVCVASSVLMLVTLYQPRWLQVATPDVVRMDPTRMAQGIVTGIGFLGAGVIFKEGLTVRGLTTAASIWMTSAIGILTGVGLYFSAAAATVVTLGVLTIFRRIEQALASSYYAHHVVRFPRADVIPADRYRALLKEHGFRVSNLSLKLTDGGRFFEHHMAIWTVDDSNFIRLADTLGGMQSVLEFSISPHGE